MDNTVQITFEQGDKKAFMTLTENSDGLDIKVEFIPTIKADEPSLLQGAVSLILKALTE